MVFGSWCLLLGLAVQGRRRYQTGSRGLNTSREDWPNAFRVSPWTARPPPALHKVGLPRRQARPSAFRPRPSPVARSRHPHFRDVRPILGPGVQAHGHAQLIWLRNQLPVGAVRLHQSFVVESRLSSRYYEHHRPIHFGFFTGRSDRRQAFATHAYQRTAPPRALARVDHGGASRICWAASWLPDCRGVE
jgi:hypothetical protein